MSKIKYKGVFLEPYLYLLGNYSDKDDFTKAFWDEVGDIMEIALSIDFIYETISIKINIHNIGVLSVCEADYLQLITTDNSANDRVIDQALFLVFSTFIGKCMPGHSICLKKSSDNSWGIETFEHNTDSGEYGRRPASDRIMYLFTLRWEEPLPPYGYYDRISDTLGPLVFGKSDILHQKVMATDVFCHTNIVNLKD